MQEKKHMLIKRFVNLLKALGYYYKSIESFRGTMC